MTTETTTETTTAPHYAHASRLNDPVGRMAAHITAMRLFYGNRCVERSDMAEAYEDDRTVLQIDTCSPEISDELRALGDWYAQPLPERIARAPSRLFIHYLHSEGLVTFRGYDMAGRTMFTRTVTALEVQP